MKYNDVHPDFLTKDNLTQDKDFIDDASTFLYERTGNVYSDPEEVYNEYMEHMRSHDVNEATTLQDLVFVRRADENIKNKTARLFHTYDKMNMFRGDEDILDSVNRIGDYAEALATAPSTYVSFFTAGGGKAAAVAGQQVTKAAVRKALVSGLTRQGIVRGAAVEGGVGAVQSAMQEGTRAAADEDYEFSAGRVAATTGISTLTGGVFGGLGGRQGARQAVRAERVSQIGQVRRSRALETANKAADETLEKADEAVKRPLTRLFVEAGDDVREEALPGVESALVQLDDSTQKRITAAAIDVAEEGKLKPLKFADGSEERITETIARGIADGTVKAETFSDVLTRYDITSAQLGLLFTADVSRAARTLQRASQVSRVRKMAESIGRVTKSGVAEEGDLSRTLKGGFSEADLEEMTAYHKVLGSIGNTAQGFEQLRRGLMTTQLQTTQRNIAGGAMRVFVDEVENLIGGTAKALVKKATGKEIDVAVTSDSMIKYMYNRSEAEVIANAFSSAMPRESQRLFAEFIDAADASAMTGLGGGLAKWGRKANFLNRMADNYYKKAIFAGHLNRLTQAKFNKSVMQMMADGEMDKITVDMYRNATTKAYELLYQKTPSTKTVAGHLANAYLRLDKQAGIGMVTGLVMPFPRFIFNQIQFMVERAPIIGLAMPADSRGDKIVKQLTGFGMVGGFAAYRATQPEGSEWYEYTNERGQTADLRPMLAGLSPFMYLGDLAYRQLSGRILPKNSAIVQDLQELAVGETLRTGAGGTLSDRIIPETFSALLGEGEMTVVTEENVGKLLGDYAATFAYNMPLGLARDSYGLLDEEADMIVETNGEVSLGNAFIMRATRGLPAPLRDQAISRFNPDIPIQARPVIEQEQDTRVELPLSTSFTGMNLQAPKSAMEKELVRLGMSTYDIYRPNRFGPVDVIMRQDLGEVLNEEAVRVMRSDYYKSLEDQGKRSFMKDMLKDIVNQYQATAFERVRQRVRDGEEQRFDEETVDKFEFETSGTRDDRAQAIAFFKRDNNLDEDYVLQDADYKELMEYLKATEKLGRRPSRSRQNFAEGGLVDDPLMLSETVEEEDVATRKQEGEDYVKQMTELGLDLAPVTGEIRSAQQAVKDFEEGNYGMATLGAIGAIPGVGMVARAGKKGVKALSKYADDLWDVPTQKITSADTSINSSKLPAGYSKLKNMDVFKPGQRVVDIGGGRFDNAVEDLAKQDVELHVYDPFNRAPEHNQAVKELVADGGADIALSNNVLNVIEEPENIKRVIQQAENAIKPGDKAYFTVYVGNKSGKGSSTSKGFQRNEPTSAYVPRVEEVFGKGNVERKGDVIIATKNADTPLPATKADAPKERTFKNEKGTTFKRGNKKYPVGKVVGNQVYFHKNYLDDMPKEAQDLYYKALEKLPEDHNFNTLMYEPASKGKPARIRFDESADFDTAREPTPGKYISIDDAGNVKSGKTDQIFHHKWMWVADDYPGFDVDNSYNWSKQWAQTLNKAPSGYKNKWEQELKDAGLPIEDAAKKYSPSDLEMSGDKTYYHGTTGDLGGFDLKKSDLGIHIGGNPKQAMLRLKAKGNLPKDLNIDEYPEGANIIPLVARIKNPLETTDLGHWNDVLTVLRGPNPLYKREQMNSYRDEIAQGKYINPRILADGILDIAGKKGFKKENIKKLIDIENKVRKIADKNDWRGPVPYNVPDDLMTQAKFAQSPRSKEMLAEIREILADEGYDSIKYENLHERGTPSSDDDPFSYIVLDTSQVRVPWAKFDPASKDSGNLNMNRGGLMSKR